MTSGVTPQMVEVVCRAPFDLALCLKAMSSFAEVSAESPAPGPTAASPPAADSVIGPARTASLRGEAGTTMTLRLAVRLDRRPTLVEVRQGAAGSEVVEAESWPECSTQTLQSTVERIVNADLGLDPFYELVAEHPALGPLTRRYGGLKPFRPASLFDMLVTAVIEQQISLGAARQIRGRVVRKFGDQVGDLWTFPRPEILAGISLDSLQECGLSRRKAEYVSGVAREVASGALDLDELEVAPSEAVRSRIVSLRGFGPWSADYILVRGLGKVDVAPVDDLGIRSVLGRLFGDGSRVTASQAESLLAPFSPFRGLVAFYALVAERLR